MALLLFFTSEVSAFFGAADTLILDGEIIEVAQKDRSRELDSIQDFAKTDYRRSGVIGKFPFYLGIQAGSMLNLVNTASPLQHWNYLQDVLGKNDDNNYGWDIQAVFRKELLQSRWLNRDVHVGVESCIGWRQFAWSVYTLDPSSLQQDSIIGFRTEGDNLWLDYITIFDGPVPVYELDTVLVPVTKSRLQSNQMQLKLGTFAEANCGKSARLAVSLGVECRVQGKIKQSVDLFWLGPAGSYQKLSTTALALKSYVLTPYAAIRIQKNHSDQWQTGLVATAMAPSARFNHTDAIEWSAWQLGLALSVTRKF